MRGDALKAKQHDPDGDDIGRQVGEKDGWETPGHSAETNPGSPIVVTGEIVDDEEEGQSTGVMGVALGANGQPLPAGLSVAGPGVAAPEGNGEPMNVGDPRGALMPWMCGYDQGPVSRRTGYPCRGKGMANGRCRFCGGNAKRGVAHPKWKGGAYSKYMPKGVATRYKEAMTDPDLLSARDEIALVQLRIQDLMGKMRDGGTADMWQTLRQEYVNVEAAIKSGDPAALDKGLRALGEIIEEGAQAEHIWSEMYEAIDAKTKVSEREWRRLRDLRQFMTVQQSMDMVSYLVQCVTNHVADREVLARITQDMDKVLSSNTKAQPPEH